LTLGNFIGMNFLSRGLRTSEEIMILPKLELQEAKYS